MNPNTGEIYSLANLPDFDPANYDLSTADARRNRAITDTFEPGSTMKSITLSILLDQNEEILARERLTEDFEIYTTLIVHRVNEVTSLEQLVQRLIGVVLTHKARIEKK